MDEKIHASKPQEQIPTQQSIIDAKRKVAEYEENSFKAHVDAILSTDEVCLTPSSQQFSCLQCNATFVSYPFSEYCPVCGSKGLRIWTTKEIDMSTIEWGKRHFEALKKRKAEIKEEKKAAREAAKKAKREAAKKQSGSE